jgi:glucose-1-phosphate thymidylyltransferase
MKALILAAGFGMRLEKGLQNYQGQYLDEIKEYVDGKPKGLVVIKGKTLFDYQFEQLTHVGVRKEDIYIQTNNRYFQQFLNHATGLGIPGSNVMNNGVESNEDRLGPIKDLKYALDNGVGYEHPLIVFASDTLVLDFQGNLYDLAGMMDGFSNDGLSKILVYSGERSKLSNHGIVTVNGDLIITSFEEKPREPKSDLINASVNLYSTELLRMLRDRFPEFESLGNILELSHKEVQIKIEKVAGRLDIGTLDDVLKANGLVN